LREYFWCLLIKEWDDVLVYSQNMGFDELETIINEQMAELDDGLET